MARRGHERLVADDGCLTVLDIMHGFLDSSRERRHVELSSTVERPKAMPMNLLPGWLDE